MELTVRQTELLKELQLLQGIVERKNTIPILANVLIEAEDGASEIRLAATDLEVGLRSRCVAAVAKGGSLTLPARKLYEIARALPDTDIRIVQPEAGTVNVTAERFSSRIQTLPREDFPSMPEAGGTATAHLAAGLLAEMVGKTQFAITSEDTRFFLNGALFLLSPSSMSLVATDGHRLALASAACKAEEGGSAPDAGGEEPSRAILPRKTLTELARLLGEDGAQEVAYERGENHLFFDVGARQLISRTIDAQFPAHERVLPKGNDKRIEFDRDRLASTLKRVALLSNERSRAVRFKIEDGGVGDIVEQPGRRRGVRGAGRRLRGGGDGDLLQRRVRPGLPGGRRLRRRGARVQGRGEPGGAVALVHRGMRVHVRDHADAGVARAAARRGVKARRRRAPRRGRPSGGVAPGPRAEVTRTG